MRVAGAAYALDWHDSWASYEDKISAWVSDAEAELLVFPEYAAMELASLAGRPACADLDASLHAAADRMEMAWALHARLAAETGKHILAGSGPVFDGPRPVNRAMFFTPDGARVAHDKQIMTRWERDPMDCRPGAPLTLMQTRLGKIGVLICYDAEFPLLGRALIEAGAEILLVPSATEGLAGYSRVRIGAMARALEGQCVVVHAPTQGDAPWNDVVDVNTGAAAVYGPPDQGFPPTGLLAEGRFDQPGWVSAEVDLEAIRAVRRDGNVLNRSHWVEQGGRGVVRQVTLR